MHKHPFRNQGPAGLTGKGRQRPLGRPRGDRGHFSRGQALVEYIVIAGLLMAALGILTVFLVTFKEYGARILALVSSEYP